MWGSESGSDDPDAHYRYRLSDRQWLVATNRHVAEPWYGDQDAKRLIDRGATPTLEDLVVFFPNAPKPLRLLPGSISKTSDLAVLRTEHSDARRDLPVLPLAGSAGPA